jgi:hypothetical protein
MTTPPPEPLAPIERLPYPHAFNDCVLCREIDADFHVIGEEHNPPGKRKLLLCRTCLGIWAVSYAISRPYIEDTFEKSFEMTVQVLSPRRGDPLNEEARRA